MHRQSTEHDSIVSVILLQGVQKAKIQIIVEDKKCFIKETQCYFCRRFGMQEKAVHHVAAKANTKPAVVSCNDGKLDTLAVVHV